MNTQITDRLALLREEMKRKNVQALIIPQSDPHLSEYLAPHWQARRYFSGFSGSAGDLVVTENDAALWTDSRYFLQAADQLEGTTIKLMKEGLPGTPTMAQYLAETLPAGSTVAIDGMLISAGALAAMRPELKAKDISVDPTSDIVNTVWTDRPALPQDKVFIHDIKYAGEEAKDKMAKIYNEAKEAGCKAVLMSALDEIAWTLNIRCNDIRHTPVATAYLLIDERGGLLFIDEAKLTPEVSEYLKQQRITVVPYKEFIPVITNINLPDDYTILVDTDRTAALILFALGHKMQHTPVTTAARLKSVKNETQIKGIRQAMVRDGVALTYAFMEIEQRLADGITELDVAEILHRHRAAQDLYFDESFGTIAGYGPHGAIVHYEATEESAAKLEPHGLLLVDSGAQYLDGTTDITRTVALGTPTADERRDFTLVLKGHIALARAVFPAGTRGAQLDVLARQFLWANGLTYLHGTGHGIGHFLGVHEGPHSIRLNNVEQPLRVGSITSNEPGLYRAGVHGIRCENLVLCHEKMVTDDGTFLAFETLTLFPFDTTLLDLDIMSAEEIEWINNYHATVRAALTPHLSPEAAEWLKNKTEKI